MMILRDEDTDSQRFVPEPKTISTRPWFGLAGIGIDEGVREGGP